jgi:hypothetical protein
VDRRLREDSVRLNWDRTAPVLDETVAEAADGLGDGSRTAGRLRVTPSTKDCWTVEFGAPSPIWQQGAVTKVIAGCSWLRSRR